MDAYQYVVQTLCHEKTATSAWRDRLRNGAADIRSAIRSTMPGAAQGLAVQDYIHTRAPVRAAIAAPAADKWEHLSAVRDAGTPLTRQYIRRPDTPSGAYSPSQGLAKDTLARGNRVSDPPNVKGMYDYHQESPRQGVPADPHELAQWVAARYGNKTPAPNLP